jgi:hypothetical protein
MPYPPRLLFVIGFAASVSIPLLGRDRIAQPIVYSEVKHDTSRRLGDSLTSRNPSSLT